MAKGIVRVLPSMFPATMIVAPNSPKLRAKAEHETGDQAPPGQGQGDGEERPQAACPQAPRGHLETGIDSLKRQADRSDHQRKTHRRRSQRRPQPGEHDFDSQPLAQRRAEDSVRGEGDEKKITGHDGRQHQRQVDGNLDDPLAKKMEPGEHVSGGDRKGQAEQGRCQGDLKAQPQSAPFRRTQKCVERLHNRRRESAGFLVQPWVMTPGMSKIIGNRSAPTPPFPRRRSRASRERLRDRSAIAPFPPRPGREGRPATGRENTDRRFLRGR